MKIFWRVILILVGIVAILQAISIVQSYNNCRSEFSGFNVKHNCIADAVFRIDRSKMTN
jgi:hypothetical protein